MRQSVGMSQQLNIIIIYILIVFALIAASLSYYKAFKINNVIVSSIEKYEGYNDLAKTEISSSLSTLGYQQMSVVCEKGNIADKSVGYCIYGPNKKENSDDKVESYSYKVTTYMYIDLPIINMIRIPIKASTTQIPCIAGDCETI